MKRLLLLLVLALVPSFAVAQQAAAQTVTAITLGPNSKLLIDTNTDAATAQAGAFRIAVDGAASVALTAVTCATNGAVAPALGVTCAVPIAQIPTGQHTAVVSATLVNGATSTAPTYSYLTITFVINNVRAQ